MAKLADALAHSRSRVTHTVARMERAGLVVRGRTPGRPRRRRGDDRQGLAAAEEAAPGHVEGVRPTSSTCVEGRLRGRGPGVRRGHRHSSPPEKTWATAPAATTHSDRSTTARHAMRAGPSCALPRQSRVSRRWVTRCGRAASTPRRSILFSSYGEVALEPEPLAPVLVVALPRQDVGGDAVEEPPVVRGDHGAAGEVEQRVLERLTGSRRRGRWWARRAAAGCRPS